MPKLTIDNREIEVPKGTKVIEAAERLGIVIPRFCYFKELGAVGACRMCAVKFLEGPVKGLEMSCMTDAQDGMVVSTTDPEAMEFRKYIIELLMLNHPHDCPVCDEGGHCLLQDETVSGGHGRRRYLGQKRTYRDQYLGLFVQHEMNRCVHCWRCRRFYQEYAGYHDLGAMQIGNRTFYGRFEDGPLESPFAGNLIDLCPTGVYTDKPSRFKARYWEMERAPSLCVHCSLGCNITGAARFREMIRVESRINEAVNGSFICDRGRYGFYYANLPDRPRLASVDGQTGAWDHALQAAADKLKEVVRNAGPESVACLGSPRNSLETQAALLRFSQVQGFREPRFFIDPFSERKAQTAVSMLDKDLAISMPELKECDFIVVLGADPVNEAPMLALALRQAYRKGATVAVIDPRPVFLPFEYAHLPASPADLDLYLNTLSKLAFERGTIEKTDASVLEFYDGLADDERLENSARELLLPLSEQLRKSSRPAIICGSQVVRETTPALAASHASLFRSMAGQSGLFYLLPGPNAFGAALLSPSDESTDLVEAMERGAIKALLVVESDPLWSYYDHDRLLEALEKLDAIITLDFVPSQSVTRADVFLPTRTLFEEVSSYINQEGRIQTALPVHRGGLPISQTNDGNHPPRTFVNHVPEGDAKTAGEALNDLSLALSGAGISLSGDEFQEWLQRQNPVFEQLGQTDKTEPAARLIPQKRKEPKPSLTLSDNGPCDGLTDKCLELLVIDRTFGSDELSAYSPYIHQSEEIPYLLMNSEDCAEKGLSHGDDVVLNLPGGPLKITVHTAHNMARGVIAIPRSEKIGWRKITEWPVILPPDAIEKL